MEDPTNQPTQSVNESPQSVNESTQVWLSSYNQPPKKEKRFKGKVLIIITSVVILLAGLVGGALALQTSTNCFTTADLNGLVTTQTDEEVNTKENFYTFNVAFNPTTATYIQKKEPSGVTVESLAKFLNEHSNKIYVVRLTAVQPSNLETPLTDDRISKVKEDLLTRGVDENSIIVSKTVFIPSEELEEADSFDGYVIVSVSSSEQCK